jgi:hypothetical protein
MLCNLSQKVVACVGFCMHETSDVCTTYTSTSHYDLEGCLGLFSFFMLPVDLNCSNHCTIAGAGCTISYSERA